jgi:cysteinyl-tRNA synthetase
MVEPPEPQHAAGMHGSTKLQQLSAGIGELGIGWIQGIDRRRTREQHQLRTQRSRLAVRGGHRLAGAGDLTNANDLCAVPAELRGHRGPKQIARFRLETFGGDDERAQWHEWQQLEHRSSLTTDLFDGGDQIARYGYGGDLAAGDLFALGDSLAVHQGEYRDVAQRIDGVDKIRAHAHQAAVSGGQSGLTLHRRLGLEARAHQRGCQALRCEILVHIARLELDHMHIARLLNPREVLGGQHGPLAQVRPKVVDEHAADHVLFPGVGAKSMGLHNWQHRFGLQAPAPVRLYNTLTRTKEPLVPAKAGIVRMYSCGPTVYRYVHIGNLRTFMLPDLLCRTLEYLGYETEQVMNITDVGHLTDDSFDRGEDKMLVSARLEKKSPEEIAAFYTDAFMLDAASVNIRRAAHYPRASDYVPQMIELITKLIEKGHAYEVDGTVYYDIASFPAYGRLSRNTTDKLLAGARGEVDPRKRHPGDFTLWKAAGEHRLQVWASPWGPGFPGWHIECSAMSMLGDRFDIHTGGADNVFPHHEAEIAQSEGVTGHSVVACWLHGEHLLVSGSRMAKSAGNFFRIRELEEQGFDPLAFRYLALQAKYRTKLNFSEDGLTGADRALRNLRERLREWSAASIESSAGSAEALGLEARFRSAIADDLDLPAAMALVSELARSTIAPGEKAALLRRWDNVLGLDLDRPVVGLELPAGAADLLKAREQARDAKDFVRADQLRAELAGIGVVVTDTPDGQRWKAGGRKNVDRTLRPGPTPTP